MLSLTMVILIIPLAVVHAIFVSYCFVMLFLVLFKLLKDTTVERRWPQVRLACAYGIVFDLSVLSYHTIKGSLYTGHIELLLYLLIFVACYFLFRGRMLSRDLPT